MDVYRSKNVIVKRFPGPDGGLTLLVDLINKAGRKVHELHAFRGPEAEALLDRVISAETREEADCAVFWFVHEHPESALFAAGGRAS